jgi:uncharacterized phage protein (TIGR02216 family)
MQMGLGTLRLPPRDFWRATPREIAAAFAGPGGPAIDRATLETLMQEFPDSP